jgi:hypothetical protein
MVPGVRGWLLVLCAWLLVGQPLTAGAGAAGMVDAIAVDGWSVAALLLLRVSVVAVGIAAGLALVGRRPAAVAIAKGSLIFSAIADMVIYGTSYFPSNRMPGDAPLYIAGSLVYHGGWLIYLFRSRRVRYTYEV